MRTQRITVADGVELHALRWDGGGTPFVLLHGLASNARLWGGVAAELAAAGHAVLAVDQRGHGRSSKPDSGYDMRTVTDDVRALLGASGFERPVLAGQSWGGNVVVEFAARFPGTVRAICCVDGGAIDLAARFPDWSECARVLRPPAIAGTPADEIERTVRSARPDWPESGIEGTLACFEHRDDGTVAPWLTIDRHLQVLRGLWEHHPTERLPHVVDRVLFLVADDPGTDADHRDEKRREIDQAVRAAQDARAEWMIGDHDLHAQHPFQVARHLRTLAD
jgi:pimeloyl-ACP methyl ester carboxylesterase